MDGDALEDVRAMLTEIGDGVACRHRYEPERRVSFDLLARLGPLRPIDRGVPACVEHGCPLLGRCTYEADFAGRGGKRAGRKFRITDVGRAVASDPALLGRLTSALLDAPPLDGLGSEPRSIFALASDLLETDLAAVDDRPVAVPMTRRELGTALRLLAAAGAVAFDQDGLEVRRVARRDGRAAAR